MKDKKYVIGLDYGTDSVRALIVDSSDGNEISSHTSEYPRWNDGKFCDPSSNVFRQHPLDYIETLESSVKKALKQAGDCVARNVVGIAVDTTGSTPIAVDKNAVPLSMRDKFHNDPDAMFILWKDHSSVAEAEEINAVAHSGQFEDYTKFCGGTYSSEWFWAKILRTIRKNKNIASNAYSWIEHCDWMPALLTGNNNLSKIKRSRCAAGHKAMWNKKFGGLPSENFLNALDKQLGTLRKRLFSETYCSNEAAGFLTAEWAEKLGIKNKNVVVAVGGFDAHFGAVGGQIKPGILTKIIGTSTCDMIVLPKTKQEKLIKGICGQVDGSIIPGMLGLEAGQSAFGDFYAWYRKILLWPLLNAGEKYAKFANELKHELIPMLAAAAAKQDIDQNIPVATDWINGRRTPFANQKLKASITELDMGTNAPAIFRAIVESTAFGAKKINECFESQGVKIKEIIAMGGIAKKSPFVMQKLADILGMQVKVAKSEQTCALGAAMFAATAAGIYKKVEDAQDAMASGFEKIYKPEKNAVRFYAEKYKKYLRLAKNTETSIQ